MRSLAFAAFAVALSGTAALAAPASVSVTLAPELQEKSEKVYGMRDVTRLQEELRKDVERELGRTGAYQDARIDLVLVDVVPNRPTFKQLGDTPGLSMESFGVGGARIEGQVTAADGVVTPVAYDWYETDIRWTWANWVWSDTEYAFERFARKLSQGQALARR
ncbi:hypothetical protein [Phenylobacterium sp. J367]|uniref:hypothetical protein n=1 Tax=Phenylobacterium sp. J367 TaxID=2898435 RepID=UPI0021512FB3|nr:hypothetical protein [Phenylobacterium sp. J367]MCR5880419.1 hypothetical protein [Phenylobacterium sp. J367]